MLSTFIQYVRLASYVVASSQSLSLQVLKVFFFIIVTLLLRFEVYFLDIKSFL